jgi:glycosyltransferase involved in cell wall biosynthesis
MAAVSDDDQKYIKGFVPGKEITIIPNGVDFERFAKKIYPKNNRPTVLFGAADFHWMQNKEGAKILIDLIWPKIKKQVKNARLWVVGKIAPLALKSYLKRKDLTIEEIRDSREAYQRAWVLVAPMRSGGGSRTKFFEAMASGLPIVTTPEGIEGIPVKNGFGVVVKDDLDKLAVETVRVLLNEKLAQKIGLSGKKLVKLKYDWEKSAEQLSILYEKIGKN